MRGGRGILCELPLGRQSGFGWPAGPGLTRVYLTVLSVLSCGRFRRNSVSTTSNMHLAFVYDVYGSEAPSPVAASPYGFNREKEGHCLFSEHIPPHIPNPVTDNVPCHGGLKRVFPLFLLVSVSNIAKKMWRIGQRLIFLDPERRRNFGV